MVNTIVASLHDERPPSGVGGCLKIKDGPLYKDSEVMAILESQGSRSVKLSTKKCVGDVQKLGLDSDDLLGLLNATMGNGRFIDSEWCELKSGGPWAACDAYLLKCKEWVENANKEMIFEYYVKFAIGKNGNILLLVSCHPPEDRRRY